MSAYVGVDVGLIPTSSALEVWLRTFWFRTVWLVNKSAGQPQFLKILGAFRCRAYVYLNEELLERGKHVVQAIEAINL